MLAHWEDVTEVRFDLGPIGGGRRRLPIEAVDDWDGER